MEAWRLRLIVAALGVAAGALTIRLVQLQLFDSRSLADRAVHQRLYVETLPGRPGEIVDRNGRLLATSVRAKSLYAVPSAITDFDRFSEQVAPVVGLDATRLTNDLQRNREKSFLWVRRRLSEEQVDAVRDLKLPDRIWGFREEFLRQYPQGSLAAHVLGLRDIDNVGRGGVEERCDHLLRGSDGRRVMLRDARGRVVEVRQADSPTAGRTIVLAIDSVIQLFAERQLDGVMAEHVPLAACAIVIDVPTGELLALANRPTFDPNHPADAPPDAWTNHAISAVYEPGSTFKPLVVSWALEAGLLQPDEVIDCEGGAYRIGRRILHDHHGYGELSVTDVLVKSSNIGMAKIGERLGIDGLHRCVSAFGFSRSTGISLPGERVGVVRPLQQWNDYSIGSVPMGHEIAATPLQLAVAHAALANGGRLTSPRLVLRDVDADFASASASSGAAPPVTSPVVGENAANWVVREAMVEVVRRGTGTAARLPHDTVFGKTGTAQKFDAETGRFSHDRHVVSFIAGAPADDPRVVVLVMVDEPTGTAQGGGRVAAPAAAKILERTLRYLGVPYEDPPTLADHVNAGRMRR